MREVRWERMFPDELEAAFRACPIVYLPYGLCEPHGPQNALGLDALKAHAICCRAARAHGGIVAPPDYWHVHELGGYGTWAEANVGEARPWLTAVPPWLHFKNVAYQIRAVDALGFRAAILLTGHYGPNWQDLQTLVEILQPHFDTLLYGLPDFEANRPGFPVTGESGDHAGKVETSLLWALEPDCVDLSRMPRKGEPGHHFAMGGNAHDANRRAGERMAENEARWLGEKARSLLEEYDRRGSGRGPVTFTAMEEIWEREVEPRIREFASMQPAFGPDPSEPAPQSRWRKNWDIPGRYR